MTSTLRCILNWAYGRRKIPTNPCDRAGKIYHGTRAEIVWTDDQIEAFYNIAPKHLHLALTLALWTGQRQGDLLTLPWSSYSGGKIRMPQSKTAARVLIPVGAPLRAALADTRQSSPVMLVNTRNITWTSDGFPSSWRKACKKAGIEGVTFNDLRGTAVTRLAVCGCTTPEICSITGHSGAEVNAILEKHYLASDPAIAESAIRKLEAGTKSPKRAPKWSDTSSTGEEKA